MASKTPMLAKRKSKSSVTVRDVTEADFESILCLNTEAERFLNSLASLSPEQLNRLQAQASHHRVACIGARVVAFLLAFRPGATYQDPNYRWFSERFSDFFYVDRIVVGAAVRGQRVGSQLYEDLFSRARL